VIADPVSSIGDVSFTLADEGRERALVKLNPELNELGGFGGMSGSAVFRFSQDGAHRLEDFSTKLMRDSTRKFVRSMSTLFARMGR